MSQLATVIWYDASSGEGMVQTDSGDMLYLNYSCINNNDINTAHKHRDVVASGDKLTVTIYENIYSKRVDKAYTKGGAK